MKKFLILLAGGIFLSAWLTSCTERSPLEPQPQVASSVQDANSLGSIGKLGWGRATTSSVPFVKYHPVPYKMRGLAVSPEIVTNGGFESGDFTGWTTSAAGFGLNGAPENVWSVGSSASLIGPEFDNAGNIIGETDLHTESLVFSGTAGASALNNGATYFSISQIVTLPPSATTELKFAIRWKNFAQLRPDLEIDPETGEPTGTKPFDPPLPLWNPPQFDGDLGPEDQDGNVDPHYAVQDILVTVRNTNGDVLQTVLQASSLELPAFSGVGGTASEAFYEVHTADISELAGQDVEVRVEGYSGIWFLIMDLDQIQIIQQTSNEVTVDIKPGSDTNPINLKSRGVIPVAILSTDDFDATTVDGTTVLFAGASPSHGSGHLEDVDGDGDLDWIGHFKTQETDIQKGDTSASLTGKTTAGQEFQGSDSIKIVK